jgi:hypothetical protein
MLSSNYGLGVLAKPNGRTTFRAEPSRADPNDQLGTRQYARLVDEWVTAIGLRKEEYGKHSLLRTRASPIYKATGNLRAV